ncbi:hypothetical protein V9K67_01350 [Paraflavisolibacter sp. H34]|uniref:hypothetical protein n=1 Tax=Huijunlia imazamoxiresistens TaxID=3127457 RepID=UPI0030195F38
MKTSVFALLFSLCCGAAFGRNSADTSRSGTGASFSGIVIPASDFLADLPKNDQMADAGALKESWVFNNTAIVLHSPTNLLKKVQARAGLYRLYVRGRGGRGSSFKVAVNDTLTAATFGGDSLSLQYGGTFRLKEGLNDIKITRIHPGAVVDVLVLTQDQKVTEEDLKSRQLHPEVNLLKEYAIPNSNAVKFGDVTGDGATDFMVLSPDFSATVFDNSGKQLWTYSAPEAGGRQRSEFEAPGVLWDFDGDARAEVVHWRFLDGKEWLVIADGQTGAIKKQAPWPTRPLPHEYNNFRLAIGKLDHKKGAHILCFTDMGGTINVSAYTPALERLWSHDEERKKDNLGHYIYPVDLDRDGIDEVLVGSLLLNAKGQRIWDRFALLGDNHDHADSYKFADVDRDGRLDIVTANSETGVFVYKAMSGAIIWQQTAEHSQQLQVGDFLDRQPGPQVVVGGRTYGNRQAGEPYLWSQLYWFGNKGDFLFKWPGNPINGNPDFVKGSWRGQGPDDLFWFKFHLNRSGQGRLFFPDPVFHMFDFTGRGAEEVITLNRNVLRVYGCATARHSGNDRKKDPAYLKSVVVNHTHY